MLLPKGVNPYEYMNDWEKFHEKLLLEKKRFYTHLNMEDINDPDYTHEKRFAKILNHKTWVNNVICIIKVIFYCWMMYLTTFGICFLKHMCMNLLNFFGTWIIIAGSLKKE